MKSDIKTKFKEVRKLFPHTKNVVYFNSASYGPFCTPVANAIRDNLDLRVAADRDDSHDAFETQDKLRAMYAEMISANKCEIGIGLSTSFGLNIAAFGLPLKEGDEILVSDIEFPAVVYTWKAAAKAKGLKIKFVQSLDNKFSIENLEKSITDKTRALSVSWVQFFNGYKNDLNTISEICKKNDIYFIVDGIQGMGVEKINIKDYKIDIFSSGCQKWMLSPQGCGFFYISDDIRDSLNPTHGNWLDADWKMKFDDLFHYDKELYDTCQRFEMGYYAVLNILGMHEAAKLFLNLGIENIARHNHTLIDRLAEYINSSSYYSITSSMESEQRSSIFTFTCDKLEKLHRFLLDRKIILVRREGSIRVSVHLFNNEEDIEKLISALKEFHP